MSKSFKIQIETDSIALSLAISQFFYCIYCTSQFNSRRIYQVVLL